MRIFLRFSFLRSKIMLCKLLLDHCPYFIFQPHSIVIILSLTWQDLNVLKNNFRDSVSYRMLLIYDEKIQMCAFDFRLQLSIHKVDRQVKDTNK